ncbi:CRISPR-associated helicase Cas3' [Pyrococcus kukulkanii]|uniref:CRISPR-associated helicase Cas3' n=1 Tax=Pyrococcus kukulkanii TaxID=1609559 RepID=UPI0035633938
MKAYREAVKRLAEVKGFKPEKRPLLEEAFEFIISSQKPFLIINAPTGYGKTLLSFALALHSLEDASLFDRVIHVLPMRSIIEDIQKTANEAFGFSRTKMMGSSGEFLHLFPLNITTVDTFTWDMLKLNTKKRHRIKAGKEFGYDYLTQASILTSLVIFDEAHFLLEEKPKQRNTPRFSPMATAFDAVLEFLTFHEVPIVVMTATLSKGHFEFLRKYAEKNKYDLKVLVPEEDHDPFVKRELNKDISINFVKGNPLNFVEPDKRNAIIVNTVKRAVELYDKALDRNIGFERDNIILIHGRMTSTHKQELIDRLRQLQSKKYLLIGTQAVEAGVDFSVDVMITDKAPINSLLQRFGRLARHANDRYGQIFIIEEAPTGPYPEDKVKETVELLKRANIHPRVPSTYREIVSKVHGERRSEVERYIHKSLKLKLFKLMKDPRKRALDVLGEIEKLTVKGVPIIRDFLVPLLVGGETVLISPRKLLDLYSKGLVRIKGIEVKVKNEQDAYEVAKAFALGRDIKVIFTGEYDRERGIV